ncbi:MAG TPA: type II toxin-antitoxin system RelE/ParE family toxin [Rhizomicrobium sp.]
MRVIVSPQASADIDDILAFIAADNPDAAVKYVAGLRKKAKSLGQFPRIHPLREDLPREMRSAAYGSHVLIFRIRNSVVDVVRIVHGARDLPRLFER